MRNGRHSKKALRAGGRAHKRTAALLSVFMTLTLIMGQAGALVGGQPNPSQ